jgi:uncharacterized membrane protein YdbT with pleckstrin-like domain
MGPMSYVQRVLQPDETVIYATRLHWLVYVRPVSLLVLAVALAVAADAYAGWSRPFLVVAAGLLALALLDGIAAALRRATTEFAVTDHRIIYKRGIIGRYTIEMARAKVESVDVQQGLAGRAFNFGTIIVRGTGGGLEPIRNVERPLRLRSAILAQ